MDRSEVRKPVTAIHTPLKQLRYALIREISLKVANFQIGVCVCTRVPSGFQWPFCYVQYLNLYFKDLNLRKKNLAESQGQH